MPVILSLDSSTLTLSLALVRLETSGAWTVVDERAFGPPRKHSELLPGALLELLQAHGLSFSQLDGISVGLGPGSFTGLRVGLATAKGLAYASQVKLSGASSLKALALEGPEQVLLLPTAVARRDELYVGRYRRAGKAVECLGPEEAMSPLELATLVQVNKGALVIGPPVFEYKAKLEGLGVPSAQLWEGPAFPKASAVAALSVWPEAFDVQAVFALEPHYVRPSEAERNPKFPAAPGPAPTARIREE